MPKIAKDAKMPGAESTEQNRSLHFESSHYGSCKLERYAEKSYIRFRDLESGKWKNIIGSCRKNYHAEICSRLVDAVTAGKSVAELHEIHSTVMEELGC